MRVDLELYPIEKGATIPLQIYKNSENNTLSNDHIRTLDRLLVFLKKHPEMIIELKGPDQIQLNNCINYFKNKHIEANRLHNKIDKNSSELVFHIETLSHQGPGLKHKGNFSRHLEVDKLEQGHIFRLNNTFFPADSSKLSKVARKELDQLIHFLKSNPNLVIEIGGHTNGLPNNAYCDTLSAKRALSVAKYLTTNGVPLPKVLSKGYGKRYPIASNENQYGRMRNQRVEFKIISLQ